MGDPVLSKLIAAVPPGRWGIGVSGGADSVALLLLMHSRPDVQLHVIHLDHQTRDGESATDAKFVADLAGRLNVPVTVETRSTIEESVPEKRRNTAARFRHARFDLFAKVTAAHQLQGVLLAHHADDQAETILMRILRGAGAANLRGIKTRSIVQGTPILRPLLEISGAELRKFLLTAGQIWREDSSNRSDQYQRNRVRRWLAGQPDLRGPLADLALASGALRNWLDTASPRLPECFSIKDLCDLPFHLAKHAAGKWLIQLGSPPTLINSQTCERLIEMATDAASPRRQHFPGGLLVTRKKGMLSAD